MTDTTVSTLASITGNGTIKLSEGINTINVAVKAENGDIRNYIIHVNRK